MCGARTSARVPRKSPQYTLIAKIVMRAAGDQMKQLCAGLKASLEGAAHAVGQRKRKRSEPSRREDKAGAETEDEEAK